MSPQPSVLVLGGVGFIGRNLVAYLVENNLAAEIRVVDKVLIQTAYFNKRFHAAFEKVEYMQGNLSNPGKACSLPDSAPVVRNELVAIGRVLFLYQYCQRPSN
jgi:nucleoside-diphosphate-sugar epimerase